MIYRIVGKFRSTLIDIQFVGLIFMVAATLSMLAMNEFLEADLYIRG